MSRENGGPDKDSAIQSLHWYVRIVMVPWKALVVVTSVLTLVIIALSFGALNFSSLLSMNFLPSPALEDVYAAYTDFLENNPIFLNGDTEAILLQRVNNGSIFNTSETQITAKELGTKVIFAIENGTSKLAAAEAGLYSTSWFYSYQESEHLKNLAYQYIFPNQQGMVIGINLNDSAIVTNAFLSAITSSVESIQKEYPVDTSGWILTATGKWR